MMNSNENTNLCIFIGNLTKNPLQKLKQTANGSRVLNMTIAVKTPTMKKSGEIYERTAFANIVIWDELAQRVAALRAGDEVKVTARYKRAPTKTKTAKRSGSRNSWRSK